MLTAEQLRLQYVVGDMIKVRMRTCYKSLYQKQKNQDILPDSLVEMTLDSMAYGRDMAHCLAKLRGDIYVVNLRDIEE